MDWTPIEHVGITAGTTLIGWGIGWLCGVPDVGFIAGAALGSGAFIGRETAQNRQRCIQNYYQNQARLAPWYCSLEPRAWDAASLCDLFFPVGAALLWCTAFISVGGLNG